MDFSGQDISHLNRMSWLFMIRNWIDKSRCPYCGFFAGSILLSRVFYLDFHRQCEFHGPNPKLGPIKLQPVKSTKPARSMNQTPPMKLDRS